MTATIEREVKLGAWAALVLPDLTDVVVDASVLTMSPQRLMATYYDTDDLRLARWGITVRYRRASDEAGWTVKFPANDEGGPGLVRTEHNFAGAEVRVPPELLSLLGGYLRTAALVAVAHLRTDRIRHVVSDSEHNGLVEIADDEVSVLVPGVGGRGRRVASRFRELEAELLPGAPVAVLNEVVDRLRQAGAGPPDPTPKVVRALGPRASAPPEVVVGAVGPSSPAGDVVGAAIASSVVRLLVHDAGVRIGDDPEDIHQARVATRRLRSDLRTFRSLLDPEWTKQVRNELGWVADLLGAVRDADVLLDRLRTQVADLDPGDAKAGAALLRRLQAQRATARTQLLDALGTSRYAVLVDTVVAGAASPPLAEDWGDGPDPSVTRLVRGPWRRLRRTVHALGEFPIDDELHRVRIEAKRCRYAVEAAIPVAGKKAVRLARGVAELQGVLGDFHDAIVAEEWLRQAAARAPASQALVAGQLIAAERRLAQECRAEWPGAWERASAKRRRSWLGSHA